MTNANLDGMRVDQETWAQQLKDAMNVNGGDVENATTVIISFSPANQGQPAKGLCAKNENLYCDSAV